MSWGGHLAAGSLASLGPGREWRAGQGGAGCGALGGFRVGTCVTGRGRWGENRAPWRVQGGKRRQPLSRRWGGAAPPWGWVLPPFAWRHGQRWVSGQICFGLSGGQGRQSHFLLRVLVSPEGGGELSREGLGSWAGGERLKWLPWQSAG